MMTSLIWVIQILHYPSFFWMAREHFSTFHRFHSRRITWIVFPIMAIELLLAVVLVWTYRNQWPWVLNLCGVRTALWTLRSVLLIWLCCPN